ncbi:MAG: DUF3301 domain-containing protein [Colwellia sp.]|nr:DUF3301 domain-containing protein [Colwellia sp.]
MENIYYLLLVCLIFWYFIYLRKVSEAARVHAKKYCEQSQLQFIAIARQSSRLTFNKKYGLVWLSLFDVEFSGDGESSNNAILSLYGLKLGSVDIPPYRVN